MNRILCLGAFAALALSCALTVRAQTIEGQIIAVQYGTWRVQGIPQPTTGNSFNFVAAACNQIAGNKTFQAFQVGTPIEIFDADPNLNEVVTPSAVSATNQGCSITAAPVHTHNSFSLGSATAGLQEALNTNEAIPLTNIVVLTAEWYRRGGTSGTIASVQGSTNVSLVDVTKAPYDWYTWNGSMYVKVPLGGANLPHVTEIISGDGAGNGVGMPEKGTNVAGGVGWVAWNEDNGLDGAHGGGLGLFDCRDTKYGPGGCLGTHPQQAMQDLANDLVCYNHLTGLSANVTFPPGVIPLGTASAPTLKLPTGNYYFGNTGFSGIATQFNATYNNVRALEFDENLTANCNGTVVTDTLQQGSYIGFNIHGCGQGGCVNVPGDSTSYANGGPAQAGVIFSDNNGWVDKVGADHNGADGITIGGIATNSGSLFAVGNNAYYIFGQGSPPYNPSTDGQHFNINLGSLDGWFVGPNVTYGYVNAPGAEYGHVAEVGVGGGLGQASNIFVNRGTIGLVGEAGNFGRHISKFRIDGVNGPGILAQGGVDYYSDGTITSACGAANVAWSSVGSVAVATPGSAQTPGTYTLTGSGGLSTGVGGIGGDGSGAAGTNAVIQVVVSAGGTVTAAPTVTNPGAKYTYGGSGPTFTTTAGGTPATFTVTMTPPLQIEVIGGVHQPFCDSIQDGGTGGDHYRDILNQPSNSFGFGPDYSTGGINPAASAFFVNTTGFIETPPGAPTGNGQNITPYLQSIQATTGTNPRVDQGGLIEPADSSPTLLVGVNHSWIGEHIDVLGGDANDTLESSLNGGAWVTCSGYNINLALPATWHFVVTGGTNFGNPPVLQEQCDSIDQNHWWVNHAANISSLPPLVQQGTVDSIGDIRSHAMPALPALTSQDGGVPDGVHGFPGTWNYAYRVWGPWGTQTSALAGPISQCMPAPGFVNNPCFQVLIMNQPEGTTHISLYRESSTDGVATAGLVYDQVYTTPQHANPSLPFEDTRIPPINGTAIGSGNYSANETGGPWECGTLPPVSAYPAVAGQRCESPATGFCYWADTTDHWKKETCTYANF
jgi:hypothetical protein